MADVFKAPPVRPYLVRAMYDWMVDNNMTPQISVNVNCPNVILPLQYAQNGLIILNISRYSVLNLEIDNEAISFRTKFGGVPHDVYIPMVAVNSIYPREDMSLGMYMYPERAYDEEYSKMNSERKVSILSAVEDDVESTEVTTDNSNSKEDEGTVTSISKHKKPNLEIVE